MRDTGYAITIVGDIDRGGDHEQQAVGEDELIRKVRELAGELEGVSAVTGRFHHSGSVVVFHESPSASEGDVGAA